MADRYRRIAPKPLPGADVSNVAETSGAMTGEGKGKGRGKGKAKAIDIEEDLPELGANEIQESQKLQRPLPISKELMEKFETERRDLKPEKAGEDIISQITSSMESTSLKSSKGSKTQKFTTEFKINHGFWPWKINPLIGRPDASEVQNSGRDDEEKLYRVRSKLLPSETQFEISQFKLYFAGIDRALELQEKHCMKLQSIQYDGLQFEQVNQIEREKADNVASTILTFHAWGKIVETMYHQGLLDKLIPEHRDWFEKRSRSYRDKLKLIRIDYLIRKNPKVDKWDDNDLLKPPTYREAVEARARVPRKRREDSFDYLKRISGDSRRPSPIISEPWPSDKKQDQQKKGTQTDKGASDQGMQDTDSEEDFAEAREDQPSYTQTITSQDSILHDLTLQSDLYHPTQPRMLVEQIYTAPGAGTAAGPVAGQKRAASSSPQPPTAQASTGPMTGSMGGETRAASPSPHPSNDSGPDMVASVRARHAKKKNRRGGASR